MRGNLKASAVLNFIFAGFCFLFSGLLYVFLSGSFFERSPSWLVLSMIFLVTTGFLYLHYSKLSVEQLILKRKIILYLGFISLLFNFVTSIILFITYGMINTEANEVGNNTKRKKIDPEVRKMDIMLKLGVFMVGIAGVMLATTDFVVIPSYVKSLLIVLMSCVFLWLSWFSETKLKLEDTSLMYYVLGIAFMIFTVLSFGYFETFGTWFSIYGGGKWLFITLLVGFTSFLAYFSYTKYKKTWFLYVFFTGVICTTYCLLKFFNIDLSLIYFIIVSAITLINIWDFNKTKELICLSNFAKGLTVVIPFIVIFTFSSMDIYFVIVSLNIFMIFNLLYISFSKNSLEVSVFAPLLVVLLILFTLLSSSLSSSTVVVLLAVIYTCLYIMFIVTKFIYKNKVFSAFFQVIVNIAYLMVFFASFIVDNYNYMIGYNWYFLPLVVSLLMLVVNFISLFNKKNGILKFEYYCQPMKMIFLMLATVCFISCNVVCNSLGMWLISLFYLVMLFCYIVTTDEKLKFLYLIYFNITLVISLLAELSLIGFSTFTLTFNTFVNYTLPLLLIIVFSFVSFLISKLSKISNCSKTGVFSMIILNLSIFLCLLTQYSKNLTIIGLNKPVSCLVVIALMSLLMYFNRKDKKIFLIPAIALILPIMSLVSSSIVNFYVVDVIYNCLWFYLLWLFATQLLKKSGTKNAITTIFSSLIILSIIFNTSIVVGLYVGIVGLILVLIGFIKKDYKGLYVVGIVTTIINIIIEFGGFLSELPILVYLLLAGLVLIGSVTYKEINKKYMTEKITCSKCGATMNNQNKYCGECGKLLITNKKTSFVLYILGGLILVLLAVFLGYVLASSNDKVYNNDYDYYDYDCYYGKCYYD
ncbi:MAG: hypothetical protein Q4G04_04140 [bacterium]|nr:hypothetical protein [bacterium]